MSYFAKPQKSNTNRPRLHDSDDEDEGRGGFSPLIEMKRKPYRQYEQIYTAQHIHFYISEQIGEPADYTDMIHRIMTAGESDTVFIHLNTPGGQLETGIQIINAMQNTMAKVITVLESTAYSMGSLIFLAGDEMIVNDNCMMMFHNFNGGFVGKGNELTSELEATVMWYQTLARNLYVPFLTDDELSRISRGEDMWMQSVEIRERLKNMMDVILKERAAEERAARVSEAKPTKKVAPAKKRVTKVAKS